MAAASETRSRVVPGMSVTMARSCSSSRLNRLLLPTLGRPTMASVSPARTSPPNAKLAARRATPSATGSQPPQNLRRGRHADIVLGEIDARFEQGDQFQQLLLQRRDAARNRAAGLLRGDARLVERGGIDQVAHGFGLRQVDAAVQEGAQGEFAGLGQARARIDGRASRRAAGRPASHGRRSRPRLRRCRSAGLAKKVTTT